ncbi:unnamed protein product (macronuclear) [Paramecium tetraurelia]|uniref:Transmembrane protein n=1 Tax=Paramecium tetraurelia TaxID=5888 RepID=A0E009_PARTE|nr:uncharacterized protein GSPATT00021794001 [Paramecium tetraurelia]CAK88626.1 unnamed protein product [Paramecium tetraurelia]|eukprot:XP_001456023.1 hypothetical protein (macronuclear) [Paramecium tetraurelia strain d4-2]
MAKSPYISIYSKRFQKQLKQFICFKAKFLQQWLYYIFVCLLSFFLMILALNQIQITKTELDLQISLNILSTLLLVFLIYEPIAIYIRIVIYRPFLDSIKRNEYNPVSHFVYFFINHSQINKIYDQLNIL